MSRQMAQTLRGLIDGKDDALADQLLPIAEHLEQQAEPTSVPIMTWNGVLQMYISLMEAGLKVTAIDDMQAELQRLCLHVDKEQELHATERLRRDLMRWLCWNDPNGCYTDEDCDTEDVPRLTVEMGCNLIKEQLNHA